MAKESGLGWTTFSVDDSAGTPRAIKNDLTNFALATPRGVWDVTGIDVFGYERLLLLADGTVTANGAFNDAANMSHAVFKTVPSSSVARTVALEISAQTLSMEMLFTDYQLTRSAAGELPWTAPGVLTGGTAPTWS